jgi:hypothetical protein
MSPELEDKLIKKYPKLFRQVNLPMNQTCMCWGLECGNGWFNIIDNLCKNIQKHIDDNGLDQVEFQQIKEKFGGLRVYFAYGDSYIDDLVEQAEKDSYNTCELCGTTENIGYTQGWVTTLCEECSTLKPSMQWVRNKPKEEKS